MAHAGYEAVLHVSGTSTLFTDEPCSYVSGDTYQITDSSKRLLDPEAAIVVTDDGIVVSPDDIARIDLLFGKVTFRSAYVVTGPVEISGRYLPLALYGVVTSFSIACSRTVNDASVMDGVSEHRQKKVGLKDASGSVGALDFGDTSIGGTDFSDKIQAGTVFVLAFGPEGSVTTEANIRARVILESLDVSAEVDSLVSDSLGFQLAATVSVDGYEVSVSLDS